MGKRSTARRLAMQALYQADISGNDIADAIKNVAASQEFIAATTGFAAELAAAAWRERAAADKVIKELSIDWPLDRISRVDHSLLRLALYELAAGETPSSVVIDESIELAKKYSGPEAAKFINGILGAYMRANLRK